MSPDLPISAGVTPQPSRRPIWALSLGVLVAFFGLYAATAQHGVSWQDSGEFQYRVLVGDYHWHSGIARAHPLYILLARGFTACFPLSARFYAINLFSGLGMAVALALLASLIYRLTQSRWRALLAVTLLGLAHMSWWMATIAEVYTWSLAGLMAELYILSRYLSARQGRWLVFLFAVNGMHVAIHNVALLNLPVHLAFLVGHLLARGEGRMCSDRLRRTGAPRTGSLVLLAMASAAWLAGAGLLMAQVLQEFARTGQGLAVLRSLLFGVGYQGHVLGLHAPAWRQVAANFALAGVSLFNPCWILALPGLFKGQIGKMRAPLLALTVLHILFWIRYFVPDQATFVLPTLGLLAVWAGIGCGPRQGGGEDTSGRRPRGIGRLVPQAHRSGRVWVALGMAFAVGLPWLLSRTTDAMGVAVQRSRTLPFRNEVRYWLVPWKQGEDSAERFVTAVDQQLEAGDVLVADATAAGPLLAARAVGRLSNRWQLVTPWSDVAEQVRVAEGLAGHARVFVVSPVTGYAPQWLVSPTLKYVREGVLWRVVRGEKGSSKVREF